MSDKIDNEDLGKDKQFADSDLDQFLETISRIFAYVDAGCDFLSEDESFKLLADKYPTQIKNAPVVFREVFQSFLVREGGVSMADVYNFCMFGMNVFGSIASEFESLFHIAESRIKKAESRIKKAESRIKKAESHTDKSVH